jgi:hypothetical protein
LTQVFCVKNENETVLATLHESAFRPPFFDTCRQDGFFSQNIKSFLVFTSVSTFFMPTQQELLARIKELEADLTKTKKDKRYGLVWANKPEDVVEQCKKELPVLVADNRKTVSESSNGPTHILIE